MAKKPAAKPDATVEVWQKVSAFTYANSQQKFPGINHLINFDEEGKGWVKVSVINSEGDSEDFGRVEDSPDGRVFVPAIDLVGRDQHVHVLNETKEVISA